MNKESSVGVYLEISSSSTLRVVPFRINLRPFERGMYEKLLSILTNLFLCRDSKGLSDLKAFYFRGVLGKVLLCALEG